MLPGRERDSDTVTAMHEVPLAKVVALVAVGAVVGSLVRYAVELAFPFSASSGEWPWGTFLVNIVGCAIMGLFLGRVAVLERVPTYATPLITTGFLGGLTTFSTFAADAVQLSSAGHLPTAAVYTLASVGLGLGAVRAGHSLATRGIG